jgi:glycosyltransferase involved in cell wall biosynthesis
MKIAIISSGFMPVVDGVTISGLERLRKLSEWGHQVLFFCPDYRSLATLYPDWELYTGDIFPGVRVVSLASNGLMGLGFDCNVDFSAYPHFLKLLKEFKPDVIHVDEPERIYLGFLRVPGVAYAKTANIPCVSFYQTNFIEYIDDFLPLIWSISLIIKSVLKKIFKYIYGSYDVTLVSSKVVYSKVLEMGFKNVECASLLGFDIDKFHPELRRDNFYESTYGIQNLASKTKIIFLGRLTPDKGWEFTLDALATLKQFIDIDKVAIVIAGEGSMRDEILARLSTMGYVVHFLGRVAPSQVPSLLTNCDLHVTTSEKETFGLTVLEALAAGIPVLAPRKGGVIENIQDGENGFLYNPGDQGDFLKKLKHLLQDPSLRTRMGQKGRDNVMGYSWDYAVKNLVEIWEQQIELKRKGV